MNSRNKEVENTGFSHLNTAESNRFSNKDGSFNVKRIGVPFLQRISFLHTLLKMSNGKFIALIILYYLIVNTFFATIYFFIGVNDLQGAQLGKGLQNEFLQAFFFSAQTITTVGYGHVHPTSTITNSIAAIESFTGILTFAVITSLIYARFSRPQAFLKFSKNALISPYKNGKGFMFRLSNYKNNHLTDLTVKVILSMHVKDENGSSTRFFNLPLEIDKLTSLAMNWTVVHDINEESPLHGLNATQLKESKVEILVQITGLDDYLFHTVQQRTSYTASEIIENAKFESMLGKTKDGSMAIVDLTKLNAYEIVK